MLRTKLDSVSKTNLSIFRLRIYNLSSFVTSSHPVVYWSSIPFSNSSNDRATVRLKKLGGLKSTSFKT